jgi:hypothetical protein
LVTQAPLPPKAIVDVEEVVVVGVAGDEVVGDEVVESEAVESEVLVSEVPIAIIVKDSDGVRVEAVEVDEVVDAIGDADVDPIVDADPVADPIVDPIVDPDPVADPVDTVVDPEVDAVDWDKVEKCIENTLSIIVVDVLNRVKSSSIVVVGTISSK